ncbi:FemAB family XrtA/PEP-CTERM system-associated protein [Aestuariispira insulae]|uniref:FemAB-related protein (PEP-CTERM system-associated) n=1 Tax=Aestuariispira insulae TaxID=1461337 RepID=A0A3D9HK27_9PROT|nr:FemAB family XrtA/PEP-CTERM system-associated protein [Aestuariispira insulae]RED49859.1 FemAB-related protein (PEP-CTERM system-associated) [Aestuariispira insulae]
MAIQIAELTDETRDKWDRFVAESDATTFFHRSGWREVIEKSFRHDARFLMAERDGVVEGILPLVHVKSSLFGNRLVSTAFCVGGGIAAETDAAHDALKAEADFLMETLKAEYVEYRAPQRSAEDWQKREGLYATFHREIEAEEEECLKQIPRKQRAVVRKALKSEMEIEIVIDPDEFYHVYSTTMRNHGTPVFSKGFIRNLLQEFKGDCDILSARKDGKVLSSVLNFYFKDRVMPYYTGALPEARKTGAADLMYWALMRSAVERGYKIFDFGRSKLGTGPFSFKKNWGFEPVPINLEFSLRNGTPIPDVNPNNPKYDLMIRTWQKLPLPVANVIGPMVSRHLG